MKIAHFLISGQSNIDQWFHSGEGSALKAFKETYLSLNPHISDVIFYDAARGGSAMLASNARLYAESRSTIGTSAYTVYVNNYWWDEEKDERGYSFNLFKKRIEGWVKDGVIFDGILWAQGEADTAYITKDNIALYQSNLTKVLHELIRLSQCEKIYIQSLGDRSSYSRTLHQGTELIRKAQSDVALHDERITLATAVHDLTLRDSVHLTEEGYRLAAKRMAIAISTGETSPQVISASREANRLYLKFDLKKGQTFKKELRARGFRVTDAGGTADIKAMNSDEFGFITLVMNRIMKDAKIDYSLAEWSHQMGKEDFIYAIGAVEHPLLPFTIEATAAGEKPPIDENRTKIQGTKANDILTGTHASEWITARDGDDRITARAGRDLIKGGKGRDVFVFEAGAGLDVILDFEFGIDEIELKGLKLKELSVKQVNRKDLEITSLLGDRLVLRNAPLESLFWIKEMRE